ncbi:MAG: GNAT family N-acetyltransferase [bacterium]
MRLVRVDAQRDARWLALHAAHGGSLFNCPPWLASLEDAYGFHSEGFLLLDASGAPRAGLPFCRIADLLGERVVSLPFSDYADPLLGSADDWRVLVEAVGGLGLPMTYRCLDDRAVPLLGHLEVAARKRWHGVDVSQPTSALWTQLAPASRRALRKAARDGVVVQRLDDEAYLLRELTRLQVRLRKRKYGLLSQPHRFFAALQRHFAPHGGWLPLAACIDRRVVAVTLYLRWGDTLYYKFNASEAAALAARPNDALLWAGIELAQRLGCQRLDLGVSDDDQPGLIRFKRQYGGAEREMRILRSPAPLVEAGPALLRDRLSRLTHSFTEPTVADEITELAGSVLYRLFA